MPQVSAVPSVQKQVDSLATETKCTTSIRNARNHSPKDKVSHPRRPESFSEMLVTMHKTAQITILEMQMHYSLTH